MSGALVGTGATMIVVGAARGGTMGAELPKRLPASRDGRVFYVDAKRGSDRGPGSKRRPWRTINKALASVPLKGSIVKVRPGTYTSRGKTYAIEFRNRKGDPANPITLMAETPGTVHIENADPAAPTLGAWIVNASGLRLQGLAFRVVTNPRINPAWGATAVLVQNSDRIEITGCTFYEVGHAHIRLTGGVNAGEVSEDLWVVGNTFRPSGDDPYAQVSGLSYTPDSYFGSKGSHYLYLGSYGDASKPEYWSGAERTVVANNVFVGTAAGRHVQLGSQSRNGYVVGNTFFGNHSGDLLGWTLISNGAQWAGQGLLIFANTTDSFSSSNNVAKNNVFVDLNGQAVYGGTVAMQGNLVERNLSYDTDNGKGHGDVGTTSFDNTFGTAVIYSEGAGNWQNVNPRLQAPRRFDFRLGAGSPAVGKADPAYILPYDHQGKPRDATPDLGALER